MAITIDVDKALHKLDKAQLLLEQKQPTDFWTQCVRDASGKWLKYSGKTSGTGVKYFRGHQRTINYNVPEEVVYLQNSLFTRRMFYSTLGQVKAMTSEQFREWLEELRHTIEYRPIEEWLHQRFATHAHTDIVKNEVIPIALKYEDPYASMSTSSPHFTDFPEDAQPHDEVVGEQIIHYYPTLDYMDYYFSAALQELQSMLNHPINKQEYVHKIAYFYQLLINLHYFGAMNASLYMNMANGLLEIAGITGIENGIVDFVALRLQPINFQRYFYDEVAAL